MQLLPPPRPVPAPARRARAFTLIELLVVIGIISLLIGITAPVVMNVRRQAKRTKAKMLIETIGLELEAYQGDFGDYPPSSLRHLGLETNGKNDGIESLVACLSTTKRKHVCELPVDDLGNLDGDEVENFNRSYIETGAALELLDPWGNPYIYFHSRDYDEPGVAGTYVFGDGRTVKVVPPRNEMTGAPPGGYGGYMIWSAGPNGRNDNGDEDDVTSWSGE